MNTETGSVENKPRPGSPSKLTSRAKRMFVKSATNKPMTSAQNIANELLSSCNVSVSAQTVRNVLHSASLKARTPRKKPYINEVNRKRRLEFAMKYKMPSRHGGTLNSRRAASPLVRLVEGEERWEAPDHPQRALRFYSDDEVKEEMQDFPDNQPLVFYSEGTGLLSKQWDLNYNAHATRGFLATDLVILNHGQVTWTTPELVPPPNYHTTSTGGRSVLYRFSVHHCPARRIFSGTGLEPVIRPAAIRYLDHSATAATTHELEPSSPNYQNMPTGRLRSMIDLTASTPLHDESLIALRLELMTCWSRACDPDH
ncbi:uncharacterized protein TNCV_3626221 [Trichonephila clavipes]|nr:uncharacterized protein TNCV_3626221 [Trichonephila clavipes]